MLLVCPSGERGQMVPGEVLGVGAWSLVVVGNSRVPVSDTGDNLSQCVTGNFVVTQIDTSGCDRVSRPVSHMTFCVHGTPRSIFSHEAWNTCVLSAQTLSLLDVARPVLTGCPPPHMPALPRKSDRRPVRTERPSEYATTPPFSPHIFGALPFAQPCGAHVLLSGTRAVTNRKERR